MLKRRSLSWPHPRFSAGPLATDPVPPALEGFAAWDRKIIEASIPGYAKSDSDFLRLSVFA
jgi:hypothetical protein